MKTPRILMLFFGCLLFRSFTNEGGGAQAEDAPANENTGAPAPRPAPEPITSAPASPEPEPEPEPPKQNPSVDPMDLSELPPPNLPPPREVPETVTIPANKYGDHGKMVVNKCDLDSWVAKLSQNG